MKKKLKVILDLDQTLICSEEPREEVKKILEGHKKGLVWHDMDGYYIVFERPGLQKFLDYLFENFIVSVWTAASPSYALFIIEKIILAGHPERKIDMVFMSPHCDISQEFKGSSKDLSLLSDQFGLTGFDKGEVFIIDDFKEVFKANKESCVRAVPFEVFAKDSEKDKELPRITRELKKMCASGSPHRVADMVKAVNKS